MRLSVIFLTLISFPVLMLLACTLTISSTTEAVNNLGAETYNSSCASCHGWNGNGDGPSATWLPVKPTSFTTPGWTRRANIDSYFNLIVVYGGEAAGKNPAMPAHQEWEASDSELDSLRNFVKNFDPTYGRNQ